MSNSPSVTAPRCSKELPNTRKHIRSRSDSQAVFYTLLITLQLELKYIKRRDKGAEDGAASDNYQITNGAAEPGADVLESRTSNQEPKPCRCHVTPSSVQPDKRTVCFNTRLMLVWYQNTRTDPDRFTSGSVVKASANRSRIKPENPDLKLSWQNNHTNGDKMSASTITSADVRLAGSCPDVAL